MDNKNIGQNYSIGQIRMNWLDFANIYFTQSHFIECRRAIDNFLETIKDDSNSGKDIKKEFDKIFENKKRIEDDVEKQVKDMGFLEKKDFDDTARSQLEVQVIHELKSVCWRISLRDGLFFE